MDTEIDAESECDPSEFENKLLAPHKNLGFFIEKHAYWKHNKVISNPHAAIGLGKCSNVFYNCAEILCHDNLCEIFACQLVKKINRSKEEEIDYIVGVPYFLPSSASFQLLNFSSKVAKLLNANHKFTRFVRSGLKESIVWEGQIPEGKNVLLVKEIVYQNESRNIKERIEKENKYPVNFLPFTASLIYFKPENPEEKVIFLIQAEEDAWIKDSAKCPLCAKRGKRIDPKDL